MPSIKTRYEVSIYFWQSMSHSPPTLDDGKAKTFRWRWMAELYAAWYNDKTNAFGYYYAKVQQKPAVVS